MMPLRAAANMAISIARAYYFVFTPRRYIRDEDTDRLLRISPGRHVSSRLSRKPQSKFIFDDNIDYII